jgi:hypothetical protein
MPWYLHAGRQFVLEIRSRCHLKVALLLLPWLRRGRRSRIPPQWEARRAVEWQQVDTLLKSLRGQLD